MTTPLHTDQPAAAPEPAELAALHQQILATQQANEAALAGFRQQGIQVDASVIVNVRALLLADELLGPFTPLNERRLQYEATVAEQLAELVRNIQSQTARARLLQGVNVVSHGR